jgi:ankyrin repeat protein
MRLEVRDVAALELWEAVEGEWGVIGEECVDRVKSLLSDGVDPNARFDNLESAFSGVAEDWAGDARTAPPLFQFDPTELPPLRRAAGDCDYADGLANKSETARLMTILLQHGADPYAVYRQPVLKHRYFDLCPGKRRDEKVVDEECELNEVQRARNGIIEKALRLDRKRRHIEQGVYDPGLDEYKRDDEANLDDWIESLDLPTRYGVRCVIHTLLRNGMLVQPIFDFLGDTLDVERRDPQGRTLFLAACRSLVGPDASTDGIYGGLGKIPYDSGICENPYPQPDNAWKDFESKNSKACTGPTFLSFFISRGANLLAVDNYGKNALHQLFTYTDSAWDNFPPPIETTLAYLIENCPSLIHQPDKAGLYPLHLAIWRMNFIEKPEPEGPKSIYHFETAVDSLLAANANTAVVDGRGNTVLHYLAGSRLGERDRMGDEQRRLLRTFLKDSVDPKARNEDGMTALELFCTVSHDGFSDEDAYNRYYAIGEEVIDQFEEAGYNIKEANAKGQTLLHFVAGNTTRELESRAAWSWFQLLRAKGLHVMAKDGEGKTPSEIAKDNENISVWWQEECNSTAV